MDFESYLTLVHTAWDLWIESLTLLFRVGHDNALPADCLKNLSSSAVLIRKPKWCHTPHNFYPHFPHFSSTTSTCYGTGRLGAWAPAAPTKIEMWTPPKKGGHPQPSHPDLPRLTPAAARLTPPQPRPAAALRPFRPPRAISRAPTATGCFSKSPVCLFF